MGTFTHLGRRHALLLITALLLGAAVACSDDDGGDTVAIGAGSDETPPAEEISEDDSSGDEPSFVGDVPDVTEPRVTAEEAAVAAQIAGGPQLAAPPDADATAELAQSEDTYGDYSGTMTIELAYYDYCQSSDGSLGYAGSATYEMAVDVFVNPPAALGGVTERSPFNLIVSSQLGVEGSLLLMSGQVVTDTTDGESALIDYWDIDRDGADFSGVLTDRWPGLVYNYLETSQLIVPCRPEMGAIAMPDSIAEGAELAGTFTSDGMELEVLAQTYDREVAFRAVVDVERE